MLTYERAADGESVACGGGSEWTHEGDLKGIKNIMSMGDGEKTSLTNDA